MIVYCISGLGADSRVFSRLKLNAEIRHIRWLPPQQQESLQQYSQRLAAQVDTSHPFALLGVSFGGVVARELAQFLAPTKLILLSSFASADHLPAARFAMLLPLLQLLPDQWLVPPCWLMALLFGVREPHHKKLLCQILKDTDPQFLRWSLLALFRLKALRPVQNLLHVHGSSDRLIPYPQKEDAIKIKGAGHFMVYTHAAKTSNIINQLLAAS